MSSDLLSFEEALHRLTNAAVAVTQTEVVASKDALGRVLAADVVSTVDVPPLDNAAMDGYAVRIADLRSGNALNISQRIVAGRLGQALEPGTVARIMTGAAVPAGADAVVMQERCSVSGSSVLIKHLPQAGEHIRHSGEDISVGKTVLCRGTRLRAAELGVAASVGLATLPVYRRFGVALFSTGDELSMPGEQLKPGGIYNSNRSTLHALLCGMGCLVTDFGIVPDNLESTRQMLRKAAVNHDLILTSGGVSVGEEDHVKQAVTAEGELALWKLAIKPGKPLAFGRITSVGADEATATKTTALQGGRAKDTLFAVADGDTGKPTGRKCPEEGTPCPAFIGLPGNPVASFVTFLMLVRPFILRSQATVVAEPRGQMLRADFSWPGDKRREFLRARRNERGGLDLYPSQSSGVLTSCAWADGLVSNPPDVSIAAGDQVLFLPFSELM